MLKAVIFDIDGTLIDSVDLHAQSWLETFERFGVQASSLMCAGTSRLRTIRLGRESSGRKLHGDRFVSSPADESYAPD